MGLAEKERKSDANTSKALPLLRHLLPRQPASRDLPPYQELSMNESPHFLGPPALGPLSVEEPSLFHPLTNPAVFAGLCVLHVSNLQRVGKQNSALSLGTSITGAHQPPKPALSISSSSLRLFARALAASALPLLHLNSCSHPPHGSPSASEQVHSDGNPSRVPSVLLLLVPSAGSLGLRVRQIRVRVLMLLRMN